MSLEEILIAELEKERAYSNALERELESSRNAYLAKLEELCKPDEEPPADFTRRLDEQYLIMEQLAGSLEFLEKAQISLGQTLRDSLKRLGA